MSDRMAGEILIGGVIRRVLIPELIAAMGQQFVGLDWGDAEFRPETDENLLDNCTEESGVIVLRLCHDEAQYGSFPDLEKYLVEHEIPFDRYSDAKYEYDPQWVCFRPATGLRIFMTNANREVMLTEATVRGLARQVTRAVRAAKGSKNDRCLAILKAADARLATILSINCLPLPPLELVD